MSSVSSTPCVLHTSHSPLQGAFITDTTKKPNPFMHRRCENEPPKFTEWFEKFKIGSGKRDRAAFLLAYQQGRADAHGATFSMACEQGRADMHGATSDAGRAA